jgi:hypothetical protein
MWHTAITYTLLCSCALCTSNLHQRERSMNTFNHRTSSRYSAALPNERYIGSDLPLRVHMHTSSLLLAWSCSYSSLPPAPLQPCKIVRTAAQHTQQCMLDSCQAYDSKRRRYTDKRYAVLLNCVKEYCTSERCHAKHVFNRSCYAVYVPYELSSE